MKALTISLLLISLVAACAGADLPEPLPASDAIISQLFPERTDLIRGDVLAADPSTVPPRLVDRLSVALPKGLPRGEYVLEIAFVVERTGRVKDLRLVKGSGVSALDKAEMKMIKKWRFRPGSFRGNEMPFVLLQPIRVVRE